MCEPNSFKDEKSHVRLAILFASIRKYRDAERIYERLIKDMENSGDPDLFKIAWKKVMLASIYEEAGDLTNARFFFAQAAPILDVGKWHSLFQLWKQTKCRYAHLLRPANLHEQLKTKTVAG